MKRFLIALVLALLLPLSVLAAEQEADTDTYNEYLKAYDFSFFEDSLDKDTLSFLKELAIDEFNFENITSITYDDVIGIVRRIAEGKLQAPLTGALSVLCFIVLSSFFQSLKSGEESAMSEVYSTASALMIAVILVVKISPAVTLAVSSVTIAADFIYAFLPVFCVVVAAGGGITTSFSTNATLLLLSQGLSLLASHLLMPMINCFLALGICSGIRHQLHLEKLMGTLKKIITSLISFLAAAFVSVLSIKTTVASRADYLGIRSVRFVINSVVPVIGGTISEGLLSIQSYSSLIKSSVGIVGMIAVALVFLPAVVEVVLWRIMLSLCLIISDIFDDKSVSLVLKAFKDTMLLMNVVLILSMMTTIISIGILIAARTA